MDEKNVLRGNSVITVPQQFVTVEIHNRIKKNKFRFHRQLVLHEMKNTQDLLEKTLNKYLKPSKMQASRLTLQSKRSRTVKEIQEDKENKLLDKKMKINIQLGSKMKQISNINQYFQEACQSRKNKRNYFENANQGTYSLPVVSPIQTPTLCVQQNDQQINQYKNMLKQWKSKINIGKTYVKSIRKRFPLKLKDLKEKIRNLQKQRKIPLKSLRQIYFSEIRQQRKTAPTSSSNLQLLFSQRKYKKTGIQYRGTIQKQAVSQIKQFIQGGEVKSYNEYSDYLSLNEFKRSKYKFSILNRVYNHVKEDHKNQFKDMEIDDFTQRNMLSVAYFIQNGNNMTEIQKKSFKKKLKLIQ